eukprot:gene16515-18166_t
MADVNKVGKQRSLDQRKKKLNSLKDKYKDAKAKNLRSGEERNMPKYYASFDEVLGTKSLVQLGEVGEAGNIVEESEEEQNSNERGDLQLE